MHVSFIPVGKGRKIIASQPTRHKPRQKRRKRPLTDKSTRPSRGQLTIAECFGFDINPNDTSKGGIEPTGDKLIDKDDDIVRFAFQNIHGISLREGLEVMPEVATIGALQIDVAGLTETNIHWSQSNRDKMSHQLYTHLGNSRIVCASNSNTQTEDGYQPGGAMLAVTGPQTGRMMKRGSDPWGRFAWTEMRGARDEGVLVISAYRVSQKKGTRSGPHTAYSQQLDRMVQEGDFSLDPRSRILKDLKKLITEKRAEY